MSNIGLAGALERARVRWAALAAEAADLYEAGAELQEAISWDEGMGYEPDHESLKELAAISKRLEQANRSLDRMEAYWKGVQR